MVLHEVHRGPFRGDAPRDDAPVPVQGQVGLDVVAALTQVHKGQEALGGAQSLALPVKIAKTTRVFPSGGCEPVSLEKKNTLELISSQRYRLDSKHRNEKKKTHILPYLGTQGVRVMKPPS